ncbi:MAG: triose-phosphate isomerase [Bacteroidales bacterium]
MRAKVVAGNWKMNLVFEEAQNLVEGIVQGLEQEPVDDKTGVIICPPFPYLEMAVDMTRESVVKVGAQNVSAFEKGAYTGEVSAAMLRSMEVDYCIIGHSERRKYFGEANDVLKQKTGMALSKGLVPIFCCGELLPDREENRHFDVVKQQLSESLFHLNKEDFSTVIIAYEPVWAIGTGVNATPEQAQEMHAFIRNLVSGQYGNEVAENLVILYGGSCNAKNAEGLFSQPDVDGGLIGGASLEADSFLSIVRSF